MLLLLFYCCCCCCCFAVFCCSNISCPPPPPPFSFFFLRYLAFLFSASCLFSVDKPCTCSAMTTSQISVCGRVDRNPSVRCRTIDCRMQRPPTTTSPRPSQLHYIQHAVSTNTSPRPSQLHTPSMQCPPPRLPALPSYTTPSSALV